MLGRRENLGTPFGIKIFYAKQFDWREQYLLLRCQQRGQLNIPGVKLDLSDSLSGEFELDKAQVPDRVAKCIVVGVRIAKYSRKFGAVGRDPLAVWSDQHGQSFHGTVLRASTRANW